MLSKEELVEMAEVFRDMADKARDPRLRLEFTESAERCEIVASRLSEIRQRRSDDPGICQ